jgi:hypothetical protein
MDSLTSAYILALSLRNAELEEENAHLKSELTNTNTIHIQTFPPTTLIKIPGVYTLRFTTKEVALTVERINDKAINFSDGMREILAYIGIANVSNVFLIHLYIEDHRMNILTDKEYKSSHLVYSGVPIDVPTKVTIELLRYFADNANITIT